MPEQASPYIARRSRMIGPAVCTWAPRWSPSHGRSHGEGEAQAQGCTDKRGPRQPRNAEQTVFRPESAQTLFRQRSHEHYVVPSCNMRARAGVGRKRGTICNRHSAILERPESTPGYLPTAQRAPWCKMRARVDQAAAGLPPAAHHYRRRLLRRG
jgi:hypothetical protein